MMMTHPPPPPHIHNNTNKISILFTFSFRLVNEKGTLTALRQALLVEDLDLVSFADSANDAAASTEGVLQTVLIAVAAVLGVLLVVLFAAFFIRTRR
jgi:hypothetical protein